MRVAIPLFGSDIAPRFGFADVFLIAVTEESSVIRTELVSIDIGSWAGRLAHLKDLHTEVLLCGGFNRAFVPLAEDLGIAIFAGLFGDAQRTLEAYARGEPIQSEICSGRQNRRRAGRECNALGAGRRSKQCQRK